MNYDAKRAKLLSRERRGTATRRSVGSPSRDPASHLSVLERSPVFRPSQNVECVCIGHAPSAASQELCLPHWRCGPCAFSSARLPRKRLSGGNREEVRVSSRLNRHDTVARTKRQLAVPSVSTKDSQRGRTRRGRAFRQRFQGQRWIQRKGGRGSWRAWRSTRARSGGGEGSYPR